MTNLAQKYNLHSPARFVAGIVWLTAIGGLRADEGPIDFERQIAPLLVRSCVGCHNGDDKAGQLDLATLANAQRGGESGEPALAPGDVDGSFLVARLRDGEMPPKGKAAPLTGDDLALLERWIASGAAWPDGRTLSPFEFTTATRAGYDWWSLQPVARPAPPAIESDWIGNPIDAFVLAKLQEKKLRPAPEADRRTLIRRVTYDLIGLPPTPEEIAAFESDDQPRAYERLVARLLASPHYGERWARHWLDIAHYADTHGFERDFRRDHAWPYRDYVIRALNDDKPYNDFLREQIAGDVLAPASAESVVATGFLAAGPWDFVGHKENKDPKFQRLARADDLDDIVTTVMTATIGLTVNCARCHTHKFDPIPQHDYYRLWSVFAGVERGDRAVPSAGREELDRVLAELRSLEGSSIQLADIVGGGSGYGTGRRGRGIDVRSGQPTARPTQGLANVIANRFQAAAHPLVDGVFVPDGGPDRKTPVTIASTGLAVAGLADTSAHVWDHINFGPSEGAVTTAADGVNYAEAPQTMIGLHANKGVTFDLDAIRKAAGVEVSQFRSVVAYGGAAGEYRADVHIYVDGTLRWEKLGLNDSVGGLPVELAIAASERFLTLVATDGGNDYSHDQVFFGNAELVPTIAAADGADPQRRQRREKLLAEKARLDSSTILHAPDKVYAAVSIRPPEVHVLQRGDTESPGERVEPGALACVTQLAPDFSAAGKREGARRAALAAWIIDPANPLTRRVIVNRLWHHHFGRGLVDTPSDFGFHGGRPSHPELLDWLADELLRCNWSLKQMHALMVLSSTYRQAGDYNEHAAAIDADNRLLWRMSPRRLEAEAVRDAVLAVSGKLNRQMYGPGFRDFEFIERYAPIYRYITADKPELWRRTVYRFTVRSVPNQFMEVLDCPNPSNLVPSREQTTTALQSLALLNNDFMLQQAGYMAERVAREAGDDPLAQIDRAYRLALGRPPEDEERRAVAEVVEKHGMFHLCRVLLNTNEFLFVD